MMSESSKSCQNEKTTMVFRKLWNLLQAFLTLFSLELVNVAIILAFSSSFIMFGWPHIYYIYIYTCVFTHIYVYRLVVKYMCIHKCT